jgi:hypothetical protein
MKYLVMCDEGYFIDEDMKCDRDVIVRLINSYVRMMNWWVVVKSLDFDSNVNLEGCKSFEDFEREMEKSLSRKCIKFIDEKSKELLKGFDIDEKYNIDNGEFVIDFESSNIMNDEFSVIKLKEGSDVLKVVSKGNELNEEDEEFIDEYVNRLDEVNVNCDEVISNVVDLFGNEEGGLLKEFVDEVVNG